MRWGLLFCLLLAGCSSHPTSPTPTPIPGPTSQPITITITETLSGGTLGTMTADVARLPAIVPVSFAGHLDRQALIRTPSQTVDLIYDGAPFDLWFYRQFARDGGHDVLRVLQQAPSVYLQTTGLSAVTVSALEATARATVPAFTGSRHQVVTWATGAEARAPRVGWVMVEMINDAAKPCGLAELGASAGHIWLNLKPVCAHAGHPLQIALLGHELGHALGFSHVTDQTALMTGASIAVLPSLPTGMERYHAAIAYSRSPGNQDVDQDQIGLSSLVPERIILD